MLEFTLVCLLCAEVPDLSLVQQPARLEALLQPTAANGAESKPAASSPSTGQTVLTLGTVTGVSLLGYGIGLSGELDPGRLAAAWAGGFVATLPVAALAATLMPKTEAESEAMKEEPLRGALLGLTLVAGIPLAAAGGVAAAEALAGYPVQSRAIWEGAVLGALVGYGVIFLVDTLINWVAPGATLSTGAEFSWGRAFLVGASFSLMASAWAAGGYSTQLSPR